MNNFEIEEIYNLLNIEPNASLEDIEKAYLRLVGKKLSQGEKDQLKTIKVQYEKLVEYQIQKQEKEEEQQKQSSQDHITKLINNQLKKTKIRVKVDINQTPLKILVNANQASNKKQTIYLIHNILQKIKLPFVERVVVQAIKIDKSIIWEQEIEIYDDQTSNNIKHDTDILLQKAENNTNIFAFPIAFLIAISINIIEPLAWFVSMWIHEFGHATIAWLSGHRALITFAGTVTQLNKSLFVYLGILFLYGLSFWRGKKEGKPFIMIIAVILTVIQFIMTWVISENTYKMLLAFGGIGGEFYLSTFAIISFYFHFPKKYYWEFWRYIVLIIGFTTFSGSFWKWHNIKVGNEAIPWGTFWGGRGDSGGDLNILSGEFGWTSQQIIGTYCFLGNFCLLIIIGFYVYFFNKSYPNFWLNIKLFFSKL